MAILNYLSHELIHNFDSVVWCVVTTNGPSQDSIHSDDQIQSRHVAPGFIPFSTSNTDIYIHLLQKTLPERTVNGSCRTEIARPNGTVVSIFGIQKK